MLGMVPYLEDLTNHPWYCELLLLHFTTFRNKYYYFSLVMLGRRFLSTFAILVGSLSVEEHNVGPSLTGATSTT